MAGSFALVRAGCHGETGVKSETEVKLAHGSAEPCARKCVSVRLAEKANNAWGQLFPTNPVKKTGGKNLSSKLLN
ncbi:hypothetical protein ACQ4WY_26215 [Janthinobacterium sp. LB2P49]|uniref:hypothetical protein n=1 Tax=Janthinobacterium sp. LB2P49 TaxID=3424198 RepID=UPI003F271503